MVLTAPSTLMHTWLSIDKGETMSTDQQFDFARRLADLAAELDDNKATLAPDIPHSTSIFIDGMHKFAECLAGERAGELYDKSDVVL